MVDHLVDTVTIERHGVTSGAQVSVLYAARRHPVRPTSPRPKSVPIPVVRPMRPHRHRCNCPNVARGEGGSVVDVARDVVSLPESAPGASPATVVDRIPDGADWRYEPDWDGLRAQVLREANAVWIISERHRPLGRYFPELVHAVGTLALSDVTLSGSLVVMRPDGFSFDLLRRRIHPSASRVSQVSADWPATFVITDLMTEGTESLRGLPLERRRDRLIKLAERAEVGTMPAHLGRLAPGVPVIVTPQTFDLGIAHRWLDDADAVGRDGLIARHADGVTSVRVRRLRTAACVVTGIRSSGSGLRSLRLGMYDRGELVEVGHTRAFRKAPARREATAVLAAVAPGARVRRRAADVAWVDVEPSLVCEVEYERLRGKHFRQAVGLARWLVDADPRACSIDQLVWGVTAPSGVVA
jgi:ATP-dependent DNA ligase